MVNYATKYSNTVDEIIKAGALSDSAVNNDYEFTGAQTVKVYSMGTARTYQALSGDFCYKTCKNRVE